MSVQKQATSRLWLCRKGEFAVRLDEAMAFGAQIRRNATYPKQGSRM